MIEAQIVGKILGNVTGGTIGIAGRMFLSARRENSGDNQENLTVYKIAHIDVTVKQEVGA